MGVVKDINKERNGRPEIEHRLVLVQQRVKMILVVEVTRFLSWRRKWRPSSRK